MTSPEIQAGQPPSAAACVSPLIIDVAGLELDDADRRRLGHPLVGGVILFARNWQSAAQLTRLCREIKRARADLLIAVDQEGGRVQRFRGAGFTRLPAMRTLGALWRRDALQARAVAAACGSVMAAELRACGVDFSFAPVLDLDWGRSGVIGDRSLGRNPRSVTFLAAALMHGMLSAGMAHCAKHFPGHGHARADSHLEIPRDRRTLPTLLRADAAPYRWLAPLLTAVMPAHVIYPEVDALPAGFSRRWLGEILREELGFDGAIVSDDLSMAAAREIHGRAVAPGEAVLVALDAGCDLALLCNQSLATSDVIGDVLRDLEAALRSGRWHPDPGSERRRRALLARHEALDRDTLPGSAAYRAALQLLR